MGDEGDQDGGGGGGDFGKFVLGAAVLGLAVGLGRVGRKGSAGPGLKDRLREGIQAAARETAAKAKEDIAKLKERRERIGDGAHDPGAVIIVPRPDDAIKVEKYGVGRAEDTSNGTFLRGSLFGNYYKVRPSWTLHERSGNFAVIAHIHGHFSEGWRDDAGPAVAVTISHCHRDSYFPYTDSMYAGELPLDRFAALLQAAHQSPHNHCSKQPIVVIDNREAHRTEHERLAAQESPDEVRFRNWRGPLRDAHNVHDAQANYTAETIFRDSAVVIFGEPGLEATYDPETRTLRDEGAGLELTIQGAGDRDYSYDVGIVRRDGETIATVTLHRRDCWRPGYGPCTLINLNRAGIEYVSDGKWIRKEVSPAELPFAPLAALLNVHPALFWNGQHPGHAVLVDTRAEPLDYYYG